MNVPKGQHKIPLKASTHTGSNPVLTTNIKIMKNLKIGKKYYTPLSEGHRPDLHPNGKIVTCIEDKENGYLHITDGENIWLASEKDLKEIIQSGYPLEG